MINGLFISQAPKSVRNNPKTLGFYIGPSQTNGIEPIMASRGFPNQCIRDNILSDPLVKKVIQSNLKNGISNSLDSKLDTALGAMDDSNEQNDIAVINSLEAFINAVLAQSGKHIDVDDADMLIDAANAIIIKVENPPCY